MIVIRDLKDLMVLDGVNNIGNKYRFEVEYRKDTNQEIVNDLIALIECINENNVNEYSGALKQIIERIDSLNQVKSRY